MDIDVPNDEQGQAASASRKRQHPDSQKRDEIRKSSVEILKLVETPNFEELCRRYKYFDKAFRRVQAIQHEQRNTKATFASCVTQEFTVALTRALLHSQFQLYLVATPTQHLCPPIPNRLFYVHWIHSDVLPRLSPSHFDRIQDGCSERRIPCRSFWGLDIGTGASCIYPLLATKIMGARIQMVATDIDADALSSAKQNIEGNGLSGSIHLIMVELSRTQKKAIKAPSMPVSRPSDTISGPVWNSLLAWRTQSDPNQASNSSPIAQPHKYFDFCMTNPPFYDVGEKHATTARRTGDGRARTNMTVSEGTYPGGGEYGFVVDMIADSICCAANAQNERYSSCLWYSSMLGKKSSAVRLHKLLSQVLGPGHVVATEYGPGHYTRWFLAWTLLRPAADAPECRTLSHISDWNEFAVPLASNAVDVENRLPPFSPPSLPPDLKQVPASMEVLVHRVLDYCASISGATDGTELKTNVAPTNGGRTIVITVTEARVQLVNLFVDESEPKSAEILPEIVQQSLKAASLSTRGTFGSRLLPQDGHFFIRLTVEISPTSHSPLAAVRLECFMHSARGLRIIDKFRNGMCAEINRTNRRWRRIFKRMTEAEHIHAQSGDDAMEE